MVPAVGLPSAKESSPLRRQERSRLPRNFLSRRHQSVGEMIAIGDRDINALTISPRCPTQCLRAKRLDQLACSHDVAVIRIERPKMPLFDQADNITTRLGPALRVEIRAAGYGNNSGLVLKEVMQATVQV